MKQKKMDIRMNQFINELFNQQYIDQGKTIADLTNDIAMVSDGNNLPSERSVRRWLDGEVRPGEENLVLLAKVFDVEIFELIAGERLDSTKLKIKNKELEKNILYFKLANSLFDLDDFELNNSIAIFLLASILFYNMSTKKIVFITLIAFSAFLLVYIKDFISFKKEITEIKNISPNFSLKSLYNKVKGMCKESDALAEHINYYVCIVGLLALLPIIEAFFYKETFFISGTVSLILFLILLNEKKKRAK